MREELVLYVVSPAERSRGGSKRVGNNITYSGRLRSRALKSGTRELTSDLLLASLYLRREGGVGEDVESVGRHCGGSVLGG